MRKILSLRVVRVVKVLAEKDFESKDTKDKPPKS